MALLMKSVFLLSELQSLSGNKVVRDEEVVFGAGLELDGEVVHLVDDDQLLAMAETEELQIIATIFSHLWLMPLVVTILHMLLSL